MQYPLTEKIGNPELLVGREKEFRLFDKWLKNIPERLSKSKVILARRKSGKTAFVQRIFNQLWSENGRVIPFYFDFGENKIWYPDLAINYYRTFASHYISFLERDEQLVNNLLSLSQIREYGLANSNQRFVDDVDSFRADKESGLHDSMWNTAYSAPHRFAAAFDTRFLVILDEFQNITQYVYPDQHYQTAPIETLAGSFHYHVESKIAPMLVTGSYVGWLINVIDNYLEAGRLKRTRMSPYLTSDDGLEAVYKYAAFLKEPITNETAVQINELCLSDPFFISCVIQSEFEGKDLTDFEGVINTVHYEISDRDSEMSMTWNEYLYSTLSSVNDTYAKQMLLHLTQQNNEYWTPQQLKKELSIPLKESDIQQKLLLLSEADLIDRGVSDVQFRGLTDGTLNLILRNRLEEEIIGFAPDLKQEFHLKLAPESSAENNTLQGKLNQLSGYFAEYQLATAFRIKQLFALDEFFSNVTDNTRLDMTIVKQRVWFKPIEGKGVEIDIVAESSCGRVVLVEVKKRKKKSDLKMVEEFLEKVEAYQKQCPDKKVLPAFLSLGGFVENAKTVCEEQGIGMAFRIEHY